MPDHVSVLRLDRLMERRLRLIGPERVNDSDGVGLSLVARCIFVQNVPTSIRAVLPESRYLEFSSAHSRSATAHALTCLTAERDCSCSEHHSGCYIARMLDTIDHGQESPSLRLAFPWTGSSTRITHLQTVTATTQATPYPWPAWLEIAARNNTGLLGPVINPSYSDQ